MPRVLNAGCVKCYGALMYPTPWAGLHSGFVQCDCPGGAAHKRGAGYLWAGARHRQELLIAGGRVAWVDLGIHADARLLWEAGIWTFASCQGDAGRARYMAVADEKRADEAVGLVSWATATKSRPAVFGGGVTITGECAA